MSTSSPTVLASNIAAVDPRTDPADATAGGVELAMTEMFVVQIELSGAVLRRVIWWQCWHARYISTPLVTGRLSGLWICRDLATAPGFGPV
jgi:hypothetical protein